MASTHGKKCRVSESHRTKLSSGANMSDVIGKVQLLVRMAIPKKVRNALTGDCSGCARVSKII